MEKTTKQLRREVYEFFIKHGCKLELAQKKELSSILRSVYKYRYLTVLPDKPFQHEIICPKCQGVRIKSSRQLKKYKYRLREAGGVLSEKERNNDWQKGLGFTKYIQRS